MIPYMILKIRIGSITYTESNMTILTSEVILTIFITLLIANHVRESIAEKIKTRELSS